jgi:hypothetical protein
MNETQAAEMLAHLVDIKDLLSVMAGALTASIICLALSRSLF